MARKALLYLTCTKARDQRDGADRQKALRQGRHIEKLTKHASSMLECKACEDRKVGRVEVEGRAKLGQTTVVLGFGDGPSCQTLGN